MPCGVYMITCTASGHIYVGSSVNVAGRRSSHLRDLRKGRHGNPRLQHLWNKHGEQAFTWQVLGYCPPERRLWAEQMYIDAARTLGDCINVNPAASSGPVGARKHISKKLKSITPEQWASLSDLALGNMLGVSRGTITAHRPAHIPSPGTSVEYISKATKNGQQRSPKAQAFFAALKSAPRRKKDYKQTYGAQRSALRWEKIKSQPPVHCAERDCGAEACLLYVSSQSTWYCSDKCFWRAQAQRQAARRAAYKRRVRAEKKAGTYKPQHGGGARQPLSDEARARMSSAIKQRWERNSCGSSAIPTDRKSVV